MNSMGRTVLTFAVIAGMFGIGATLKTTTAAVQAVSAASQAASTPTQGLSTESPKVAAGEIEARKLLLLMDTDKNGKVSKAEFMNFMALEFDRLDKNKDGELDVKELVRSQLQTVRRGGGHR